MRISDWSSDVCSSDLEQIRTYAVSARSTDTFGRVLCGARNHQFVIDGPVQNGCPGEELTPPEVFLSGVASCGVELLQVLARQEIGRASCRERVCQYV